MAIPDPTPAETLTNGKRRRLELVGEGSTHPKKTKHGGVWANLDLILSLQSKDLDLQRKIELAFDFVTSEVNHRRDGGPEPVSIPRLVSFLSDWIQPILISSGHSTKSSGLSDPCLDSRCWVVLRFCLNQSSAGVSPNLLRAVARVSQHASLILHSEESNRLFEKVLECLSLLLSSNARAFYNAGVELWVSSAAEIVHLVCRILSNGEPSSPGAEVLLSFSSLMLEHFSSFLRFHPNPRNVFRVFVDRLLEPSLELLVLSHLRTDGRESGRVGSLLRMIEDVLSNGLFHPVHVSGFVSLRSSNSKQEARESKGINESYHRHFFQKLEKIISEKKAMALGGFGYLFRMFVTRVKARRQMSLSAKGNQDLGRSSEVSEEAQDTSKPLFEVFVQFMQPLLLECRRFAEKEFFDLGEVSELRLVEAHCMLKSMNETLVSFIREKVYVRMEDTSEGAHYNFLKEVHETIISISGKMYMLWLSALHMDDARVTKMLPLIAREVVVAVGYFLEIEYKVVEDDLVKLWLLMFSYLAAYMSSEENKPCSLLTSEVLNLGSKLINVYSELRQVDSPIFALCKAMRLFVIAGDADAVGSLMFVSSKPLSCQICLRSVATLLCSQELRRSITTAINSIPEGQASGCIQQLNVDIIDSLEWMSVSSLKADEQDLGKPSNTVISMLDLDLRAELLGFLSEIYTIVLDSITVTATNSVVIGNSIKNLMQTIRPAFSNLVQNQSDGVGEFFFSVTGRKLSNRETPESRSALWITLLGMHWIFVFFFRMYISCRSLYRQSISLMPPSSSRKASVAMGNLFTVSCSMDWIERPDSLDEGYFSWIVKPSISLPDLIKSLPEDFLSGSFPGYAPLVYVIHAMAIQRLVDLNRLIKAFEFLQERDARLAQMQLHDTADIHKLNKKWKKLITVSRHEAVELANFMTGYIALLDSDRQHITCQSSEVSETATTLLADEGAWDLGVCSLNENSLPTAIWWLLCQNTDIWCPHATNKNLKKFLSYLFHYLFPCGVTLSDSRKQSLSAPLSTKVTMHHISLKFLNDTALFEQTVLYKHFASRFCRILKKSLSPIISHAGSSIADMSSLPDWSEILDILQKGPTIVKEGHVSPLPASDLFLFSMHYLKHSEKQSLSSFSVEFKTCENLLNLLCKMLGVFVNDESFSLYATYVINLERLLVSKLLSYHGESFICNPYYLLSLFKSCRRAVKYLVVASVAGNSGPKQSFFFSNMFNSSSSILWLLKSVSEVVGLPHDFFGESNHVQMNEMIFSLMDHTSCIFFMISKSAMSQLINDSDNPSEQDTAVKDHNSHSSKYLDVWKYVELVSETLKEQTRNLVATMKSSVHAIKLEACITLLNWNKLSSLVSCFQGFLWGLASGLDSMHKDCSTENSHLSRFPCVSKLSNCIAVYEDFVQLCLNILLLDCSQETEVLHTEHNIPELERDDGLLSMDVPIDSAPKLPCCEVEHSSENHHSRTIESGRANRSASYYDVEGKNCSGYDHTKTSNYRKQRSSSVRANSIVNVLKAFHKIDLSKLQNLKGSMLRSLLKGENPQIAFTLRELFMASAAILKLSCMLPFSGDLGVQIDCSHSASRSMAILLGTSHLVLLEMSEMVGRPDPFSFVWLDGILKFLEVVGDNIKETNPNLSKDVYALFIDTHLRAIGKCISLQGKAATLSSHEMGSNIKMLLSHSGSSGSDMPSPEHGQNSISTFKARLRMSFKRFISGPRKLHLKTVIQALERALVGVRQNCNMVHEINTGNVDGGSISSVVAGGIDCLDLVLESVSGKLHPGQKHAKQRHDLVKNIRSLIGAIFNIVLHLQNPTIFYLERLPRDKSEVNPDPGSVILMCVEVLTKVAGNHSFEMYPCHVSQCLHLPMPLFQSFHRLGVSHVAYSSSMFSDNREARPMANMHQFVVDRQFSVDLYASCCRLLCTTLTHQKSMVARCVGLLEDSVSTLLSCLETADADLLSGKGYFRWELQEAIKCASFLRRIYEEIRQQKDVFGSYSSNFLSTYINIYSGYGPLKTGIKRDIDEALRPGVYSLVDICTPDDLQQLHTILGEGPCRSTLATLLHDYRLNFQFEGKI